MKLLLNADDLGYTPLINQAIFDLHKRGRLNSTSLLVNQNYSQAAIKELYAHPNLGVGVHLNLTKGRPLLPQKQIPSLIANTGEFWPTRQFFTRALSSRIDISEIEAELCAQIERLLAFGIRPTHLDSHSHWQLLPPMRQLIARFAEDYHIPAMRQSSPWRTLLPSRLWLRLAARKTLFQPADQIGPSTIHTPDYLLSLHQWMAADGQPNLLFFGEQFRRLIARPGVTLELVTHLGADPDPNFPTDTLLTHQRQWEVDFLLSSRFAEWVEKMGAETVNYRTML